MRGSRLSKPSTGIRMGERGGKEVWNRFMIEANWYGYNLLVVRRGLGIAGGRDMSSHSWGEPS